MGGVESVFKFYNLEEQHFMLFGESSFDYWS